MYPKWLYTFNHWLWMASLGVFALMTIFTFLIFLPFNKFFSYEFICWLSDFAGWVLPGALAAFVLGTSVCAQYAGEEIHKQRVENEKKEQEQK